MQFGNAPCNDLYLRQRGLENMSIEQVYYRRTRTHFHRRNFENFAAGGFIPMD